MVAVASRADLGTWWLRRATYFTVLAVTAIWGIRFIPWARARWASPGQVLREHLPEVALAVAAMGLLFLTHDWQFKVLSDETNFVAAARSMALEQRFDFPEGGKFFNGSQHGFDYVFDKRPPLFPFLLSLVDAFTGYRVRNVWFLNGAILGATIVVAGSFLRRRIGRPWSLLAVVWAIANPVVFLTSSAAGVEPLLCLVWAIAGVLALDVLEAPSAQNLGLLIATVYLIGLCRLEAGPLALVMLVAIVAASPRRAELMGMLRDDALVWAAPVAALPVLLVRAKNQDYFQGLTTRPFGLEHVAGNVSSWAKVLKDGGRFYPYSAVVTVVEVVALVVLVGLVLFGRTAMSRAERAAFLVFSGGTAALFALYSAYFWGQPTNPACSRFYALPLFFAGLTVPGLLLQVRAVKARPAVAGVVSALVFLHAFASSHNRAFANAFTARRQHHLVADYLLSRLPAAMPLVVTTVPAQFVIYDVGAVSFEHFKAHREEMLRELDRKLYTEVLFVQEIDQADGRPTAATALPPEVTLENVMERQHTTSGYTRISRWTRDQAVGHPRATDGGT
jgi:hypothetical protein